MILGPPAATNKRQTDHTAAQQLHSRLDCVSRYRYTVVVFLRRPDSVRVATAHARALPLAPPILLLCYDFALDAEVPRERTRQAKYVQKYTAHCLLSLLLLHQLFLLHFNLSAGQDDDESPRSVRTGRGGRGGQHGEGGGLPRKKSCPAASRSPPIDFRARPARHAADSQQREW